MALQSNGVSHWLGASLESALSLTLRYPHPRCFLDCFVLWIVTQQSVCIPESWGFQWWPIAQFNSLWPSDAIWRQRSGSTLAQVMACCLTHQAITWTNVDLSWVRVYDNHLTAISPEISQASIDDISFKIAYLKFHSNLPGANELRTCFSFDLSLIAACMTCLLMLCNEIIKFVWV